MKTLNVGCGENKLHDAVNLDGPWNAIADMHTDLEEKNCLAGVPDSYYDQIIMSHVIEHIRNLLPLMEELHRVAKPDARLLITCPHAASDDAVEDPTHVRFMVPTSFAAFSQQYYWKADYGYRGDWQTKRVVMLYDPAQAPPTYRSIMTDRNKLAELYAELVAIKPIRDRRSGPPGKFPLYLAAQPQGYRGGPLPDNLR